MQNPLTIFVTGATGKQGGAVARNLIANGFMVKALTRDPSSAAAASLKSKQIQLIKGDLNEPGTYSSHLKNVHGIFSVQALENGIEKEIDQGISLANLAKEYGIRHFLYSSVAGADLRTGIPHWESKFKIETHIKQLDMSHTIIRPAFLFENFLIPQVRSRLLKGKLVSPINESVGHQFIGTDDIGRISTEIFGRPEAYRGQTITLASDQMNLNRAAIIFSEILGRPVQYRHLPGLITRLFMGKNLYLMFRWLNKNQGIFLQDLAPLQRTFPGLQSLEQWARTHLAQADRAVPA
jgi:uncharacterized protein YbjT (DUF2867 family)